MFVWLIMKFNVFKFKMYKEGYLLDYLNKLNGLIFKLMSLDEIFKEERFLCNLNCLGIKELFKVILKLD